MRRMSRRAKILSVSSGAGFSLIELLIVVSIIGIIAAIAVPNFIESKAAAGDAAAKADLKSVMRALDQYLIVFGSYPASEAELSRVGFTSTANVTFSTFNLDTDDGVQSVHMHVQHSASSNKWHARYPKEGREIQPR